MNLYICAVQLKYKHVTYLLAAVLYLSGIVETDDVHFRRNRKHILSNACRECPWKFRFTVRISDGSKWCLTSKCQNVSIFRTVDSETAPHPKDLRAESYIFAARNLTSITRWRVVLTQFSWECAFHLQFVVFFYSSKWSRHLVVRRCSLTFERSNSLAKTSVKKGDDKSMIFILDGLSAGVD